jgi:hypothetical protein
VTGERAWRCRASKKRLPIRWLYGPNLGRELVKDYSAAAWKQGL